ncbi:MAG: FAD-dependent oxidoreductase [Actinomycetota bacterium]
MKKHVVILGAGFAGLELATQLSSTLRDHVDVTLIDSSDSFVFGFSKLDVLFGRTTTENVRLFYRDIDKAGVVFRKEEIISIEPESRRVRTDANSYDADILVVALGAAYDYRATPGFMEGGFEYYSLAGAERLRDALGSFDSGRVLIAVLGEPYKCPPAPFEGALLLHDYFSERGIRGSVEINVAGYMAAPVPIATQVSQAIHRALIERGVGFLPKTTVTSLDVERRLAATKDDSIPYDLFIGIPVHKVPDVVKTSGLTGDGNWIPIETANLRTPFPDIYAVGDVAGAPMAKAGVFAEAAARVVAGDIAANLRGTAPPPPFDGAGNCYIEFGGGLVAKVEANFLGGPKPTGRLVGPSRQLAADKAEFASTRRQLWFGR